MTSHDAPQKQCIPIADSGAKLREGSLGRGLLAEPAGWFGGGCKANQFLKRGCQKDVDD